MVGGWVGGRERAKRRRSRRNVLYGLGRGVASDKTRRKRRKRRRRRRRTSRAANKKERTLPKSYPPTHPFKPSSLFLFFPLYSSFLFPPPPPPFLPFMLSLTAHLFLSTFLLSHPLTVPILPLFGALTSSLRFSFAPCTWVGWVGGLVGGLGG